MTRAHHVAAHRYLFTLPYRVAQVTCTLEQLKTAGDTDFCNVLCDFPSLLTDPSLPGHIRRQDGFPPAGAPEHTLAQSAPDVSGSPPRTAQSAPGGEILIENYALPTRKSSVRRNWCPKP